jgi:putative transposase
MLLCSPYLLRGLSIERANQVWCADVTYIPKVLSWRLSNTLDTAFCVEALNQALAKYGPPDIFNTDQGCQFTSEVFTGALKEHGIQISMDGKGR